MGGGDESCLCLPRIQATGHALGTQTLTSRSPFQKHFPRQAKTDNPHRRRAEGKQPPGKRVMTDGPLMAAAGKPRVKVLMETTAAG
ncbi:hypothetical protein BaRGS_00004314 [Batillaria attramentaria]|uniref:Uncharacterized protein n=1 Tax=Batillaria attramentaria TaxID=370345 RepID=A0ABD0LZ87_9CAEN